MLQNYFYEAKDIVTVRSYITKLLDICYTREDGGLINNERVRVKTLEPIHHGN